MTGLERLRQELLKLQQQLKDDTIAGALTAEEYIRICAHYHAISEILTRINDFIRTGDE